MDNQKSIMNRKLVKVICALPAGGDPVGGGGFFGLPTLTLLGGEYA